MAMLAFSLHALKRVAIQLSGRGLPTISSKGTDQRLDFCASCRSDYTFAMTTSVSYRTVSIDAIVHKSALKLSRADIWALASALARAALRVNLKPL